jgi:hypothetical protein
LDLSQLSSQFHLQQDKACPSTGYHWTTCHIEETSKVTDDDKMSEDYDSSEEDELSEADESSAQKELRDEAQSSGVEKWRYETDSSDFLSKKR